MKKERRTKDASGAPAKGHGERALADAPLRGAAFKALPLQLKLGGFPESSGLTLARRSIVAGATVWLRHGYSTRRTGRAEGRIPALDRGRFRPDNDRQTRSPLTGARTGATPDQAEPLVGAASANPRSEPDPGAVCGYPCGRKHKVP